MNYQKKRLMKKVVSVCLIVFMLLSASHIFEIAEIDWGTSFVFNGIAANDKSIYNSFLNNELKYNMNLSVYDEENRGIINYLIHDFNGDGKEELLTAELWYRVEPYIVFELYHIQNGRVENLDNSDEYQFGFGGNGCANVCATITDNVIILQKSFASFGASRTGEDLYQLSIENNAFSVKKWYHSYEFYRYDFYEYTEEVSKKSFSDYQPMITAMKKDGLSFHYHNDFDYDNGDYTSYNGFKNNHIFTIYSDSYFNSAREYNFIYANDKLADYFASHTSAFSVPNPTNLKVTATNTTALNLTWNKVSDATGYVVYQYNASTKKYTKLGATKTNSYKATNLKAGTTYQFAVKAYKSVDGKNYYSDYSALLKASTTAAKQFSFKSNDTNYILQHVSFIKNTLYKDSVKKDLRFAKTLWNTYHNGGGKAATEFAYDIMEGAYQTITFDFDYKAVANPYDLILLKLLADNSQTESEKEDFESKLIETFCTYFDKFLTLTQAEDEWSDADVKGALEDMIAFKEKNLDGNKLIQFFKKKVKNQNVSELMEAIFGKLSYYTDVVDTIGTIATGAQYVIDIFKTVSTIEAYRKTSNEFKTVLAEVKNEMTAHKDAHGKNFLKAYNIVTTDDISKIVTSLAAKKSLLFGADLCSDVAKEGIKSILKAKGMADAAISKLSAWLFAYEVGFMLGNMITGNDVAVACRRTMRAYYILESAMFNTLTKLESRLVLNQNLTNANTFDEAFNLFKKVQINFLDTHREFYENANKKIVVNWVTADGAISGSQIKITNKRKELWQKIVCHHKETDLTFRVADGVYTGKSVEPVVTVNCGYIELRNGTDFKVTYKNNVKIGKSAVATITGIGNYQGSKEITFSILPKKVSGLKVTAVDKTSLSLKWNKVGGATGYVVYRYNTSTKEYTKVGAIKTNTYKVTGLKAGKTYRFAVRAYRKVDGKNIYGSYSAFLKATTKK